MSRIRALTRLAAVRIRAERRWIARIRRLSPWCMALYALAVMLTFVRAVQVVGRRAVWVMKCSIPLAFYAAGHGLLLRPSGAVGHMRYY